MPPDVRATGTRAPSDAGLPTTFGHKPALDGLRAVAVGGVMAFHFGANGFNGGFLGVDTFFVLSGYLITSLLLTEWGRTRTLDLIAFWARRAKRLLPALFLVLIAIGIWSNLEASPVRLGSIRADMLWTLFYGANWHFIRSGQSYFDLFSEASPLRHAWSLAIEEQFYLFWPLITFAAMRLGRGRPRVLAAVCVVGIAASCAVMVLAYDSSDPSRAYYGTDARASQLLVGALLAILLTRWSPSTSTQRRGVQALGLVGAAFTLWAFTSTTDTDTWLYHGGFLLFAVATAFMIVAIVQPTTSPVGRVLSLRPVRWVGMISYGLYLWHWPIQVAVSEPRTGLSGWGLALVRLALTFGIATASYYVVERPIRRGALEGMGRTCGRSGRVRHRRPHLHRHDRRRGGATRVPRGCTADGDRARATAERLADDAACRDAPGARDDRAGAALGRLGRGVARSGPAVRGRAARRRALVGDAPRLRDDPGNARPRRRLRGSLGARLQRPDPRLPRLGGA